MKLVSKSRGNKGYKGISKKRLLSAFSKSELIESKNSLDDETLKKVTKDFNDERLKNISEYFNELKGRFLKP